MPRLTDATYLKQREALADDWLSGGGGIALSPPREQLILHEYYRPAEYLTDQEALVHRRKVGKEDPSLPQRAGKVYRNRLKLLAIDIVQTELRLRREKTSPIRQKYQRATRRELRVRGLLRPKPNYELLAKALIEHVQSLPNQDEDAA